MVLNIIAHEAYLGGEGQPPLYVYIFNLVTHAHILGFWVWGIQWKTEIELDWLFYLQTLCLMANSTSIWYIFEVKIDRISSKTTRQTKFPA